jgi:hypothetical protein
LGLAITFGIGWSTNGLLMLSNAIRPEKLVVQPEIPAFGLKGEYTGEVKTKKFPHQKDKETLNF